MHEKKSSPLSQQMEHSRIALENVYLNIYKFRIIFDENLKSCGEENAKICLYIKFLGLLNKYFFRGWIAGI